jgi:hypothetical protein
MPSPHSRRRLRIVLLCTGLCLVIASALSVAVSAPEDAAGQADKPGASSIPDRLFVAKPGQDGVYTEVVGTIRSLTCNEIVVDVASQRTLYERKTVRRVLLSQTQTDDIKKQAAICWSQEESQFVAKVLKALQGIPVIGQVLSAFSESLSSPVVQMILAILILTGLLVYVAYKAYEIFFVATNMRNLNIDKLSMEVRKLRYELDAIEKKMGVAALAKSMPAESEIPVQERAQPRFELPQLHILDFVKYKILRMLTEAEKQKRSEKWRMRWQATKGWTKPFRWLAYYCLQTAYLVMILSFGIATLGYLADVLLSVYDPELGPSLSVFFLVLSVIFLSFLLRMLVQRRIISDAYRETFQTAASTEAKTA